MTWAIPAHRRDWVTLEEATKILVLGSYAVRERLNDGRLYGVRSHNRWRIPRASIDLYLLNEAREQETIQ